MKKIILFLLLAVSTVMVLSGCGNNTDKMPFDKVSVRLKWLHQAQFAGFYAAEQNGFYAGENIEITLEQGGIDIDEIEMAISGENDFCVVEGLQIISPVGQGAPIKAIAVIFRRSPTVYFSLKDSGIIKPDDFAGKKVLVFPNDIALPAMLKKVGVTMEEIIPVAPTFNLTPFFEGNVDVWTGYLTNQVITAKDKGVDLNLIFPSNYGFRVYGDTIITSSEMIKMRPDLVERFLRATLKGWRWAIENPKKAALLVQKYDKKTDLNRQIAEMEASIPLIHTGKNHIGWMEDRIWESMHELLLDQGIIREPVDLEKVYTTRFLEKIYGGQQ